MRLVFSGLIVTLFLSSFMLVLPVKKMRYTHKIAIKVPEPSDICFSADSSKMYIVSDQGFLYETDLKGKIIRKSEIEGTDFEGVYADKNYIYVADETSRRVIKVDPKTLAQVAVYEVPYSGGRNSGVESLTYNAAAGTFVMITEKNPIIIFELDKDFRKINQRKFKAARDIAAATFHDGYLWLLSDEDMKVFKLNPITLEIVASFAINVPNPEGIAFDREGKMIICGDDTSTLYFFNKP